MIQSSLHQHLQQNSPPSLLITADSKEALKAADVARYHAIPVFVLPEFRAHRGDDLRSFQSEIFSIIKTLFAWHSCAKSRKILIAPIHTILHELPDPKHIRSHTFAFGDTLDINTLKEMLFRWGYTFVDVVEISGEVSFRGDIIDIFPLNHPHPIRISLFDTEIESIRYFEVESQKSIPEEIEEIAVLPAFLALDDSQYEALQSRISQSDVEMFVKDVASLGMWCLGELAFSPLDSLESIISTAACTQLDEIYSMESYAIKRQVIDGVSILPESSTYKDILIPDDLQSFLQLHQQKKITLIAKNDVLLKPYDITSDSVHKIIPESWIINIMGGDEIIISLNKPRKKEQKRKASLVLDELKPGDYIVHEEYGVGLFEGIKQAQILGATRDFVTITYQGEDKLLLPVENLEVIDRYIADSGSVPVLDRLGKGSFGKLKAKVREKLFAIAGEIVNMAAERELAKGYEVDVLQPEIKQFQRECGFLYTPDQERSVEEIFNDLRSGRVMDRLLSGDVGFGKTEVAMNAIFAVVKSGLQAIMIVPTTLLSHQHYMSLRKRFTPFGIRLAKLDRFVTAKEKKSVLQGLQEGTLDIVVGTHALLGAEFHKLALVIVDEEHKFGVKQKEKIKALRENIHMLSMSATPIPRTLNMALSHIKGMSQILTPPGERVGVRTFVKEFNENLVKEVILREHRRGGQVFYIHNNIATLPFKQRELEGILPDLKIALLHSKVDSAESEKILLDFEEGNYDLLLSTSIVESGLHLPNANTMVIDGADRFGIADLHQLRGRVGRTDKEGFCYFLIEDKAQLTPEATKRLVALENNSYLGSGSVLAYHDLEIRGGGNLIGEAQSGHIKNIGYALYLRMLEDAINQLSGKMTHAKKEVDLKLSVNAYISHELVSEDRVRLELYRRLSKCEAVNEVYAIEEEMIDRFGKLDISTRQFLDLILIKILALGREIKLVSNYQQNITFVYENERKESIKAPSKDDDDILDTALKHLRKAA